MSDKRTLPSQSLWEQVEPSAAGWQRAGIERMTELCNAQETDCLLIIDKGRMVYSWGDITHKYLCHSIRKSFLAAMMGEDVAAGTINFSASMHDLGIDDHDPLSEVERAATIYDLITARSGIYHPAGYETPWMQMIKEKRHSHAPGTFWCYNNWDFNALGSIFVQQTGLTVAEAFAQRIATPLGMEDFSLDGPSPDGWLEQFSESRHPAYPFRMSSRDMARFGQLCLQQGIWAGQQILPLGWVEEMTMPYSHAGAQGAYGYMWWLERDGVFAPGCRLPAGSYSAVGAGGHYCLVVPALELVIIHRVDTDIEGRALGKVGLGRLLKAIFSAKASASS